MDAEVIARDQRFTLHGLKHRGITDTRGKRADKKDASGHKSEVMLDVYDHEVAIVDPARPDETEGNQRLTNHPLDERAGLSPASGPLVRDREATISLI